MQHNLYSSSGVGLAVSLVNARPATLDALRERCEEVGIDLAEVTHGPDDLTRVYALLDDWERVVDAPEAEERARLLNVMLAAASAYPRITDHAGDGWHLHHRDSSQTLSGVLAALIAVRTAVHLTDRGMDRLGRCALEGCDLVYADTSRTGRQRYCSAACANRDAVRRHRALRRTLG